MNKAILHRPGARADPYAGPIRRIEVRLLPLGSRRSLPGGGAAVNPPTVDLAAARAEARRLAREADQGLVALPRRKPVLAADADERVDALFEHARRVDCKTINAESTNLLANAARLAANVVANAVNASGCKW